MRSLLIVMHRDAVVDVTAPGGLHKSKFYQSSTHHPGPIDESWPRMKQLLKLISGCHKMMTKINSAEGHLLRMKSMTASWQGKRFTRSLTKHLTTPSSNPKVLVRRWSESTKSRSALRASQRISPLQRHSPSSASPRQ